jgi:Raf kinase inhibitor-like YbhB/YbcL family protein
MKGFGLLGILLSVAVIAIVSIGLLRNSAFDIIQQQRSAPNSSREAIWQAEQVKHVLESNNSAMNITSSAFLEAAPIPKKYTCDGENISPPLTIHNAHPDAKSLALIVDDPDAPGGTWVHWIVWNISAGVSEIPEGTALRDGLQGRTSFGNNKYGGPCPPNGLHRYFFKLYALDIATLNLPLTSDAAALQRALQGHVIADAKLMGTYSRD